MKPCFSVVGSLAIHLLFLLMPIARDACADELDFSHDIVPILRQHCAGCHGDREAKGSFSINTRELVEQSGHVEVGKPEASYLIELIVSEDPELQMPPPDKPRVSPAEREKLARWIAEGLKWEDGFSFAAVAYEPPLLPRRPELPPVVNGRENPIDRIIDAYLAGQGIQRSEPLDDAAFLRRVSLDLVGLLPEPSTLREFLADTSPDKRARAIDRLLEDKIAYADHWLSFFNDLLRNDYSGTGFITGGRSQISGWLYEALVNNKPFDTMARELIAPPTAASRGYIDGIRWRGEVSAGQTVEIQFAQSVAQSFLGINMKCASCHDSFIDRWKLEEAFGLAAIYANEPLEIHRCDKPIGRKASAAWLFPEIGQVDPNAPRDERLTQLANLMTHPDNGRFTRTIVNRLWYKLMGHGIVHPLDSMQTAPWNADLLDLLAVQLSDHEYDLKAVLRLIANSGIYQSRSLVDEPAPSVAEFVFRGPLARRLTAEQFMDSVWQVTGAAPTRMDAPVLRAAVDPTQTAGLVLRASWIWGDSAAEGKVPPAGETLAFRKTFELDAPVARGGAVVTCDNSFRVYVNGRHVIDGNDWSQPEAVALYPLLRKGKNELVVVATNAGDAPNPAALFFEARLITEAGTEVTVASDASWQMNTQAPAGREGRLGAIPGDWSSATVITALDVWQRAIETHGPPRLAQAISGNMPMLRAALMKNDFFMKSLGRPLREQIVSMRPSELTTLEAIDLANGETLADALQRGAERLIDREWADRPALVHHVFEFAFSRPAEAKELEVALEYLGETPTEQSIEDFLWSVFMSPEFFLVR
jgi:hypothetical protein